MQAWWTRILQLLPTDLRNLTSTSMTSTFVNPPPLVLQPTRCIDEMAQPIEQLIGDIPPVTRVWVAAAIGTSILVVSSTSQIRTTRTDKVGMSSNSSFTTLLLVDDSSGQGPGKLPSALYLN